MKKILGIFLSVCMVVTMLPSANVTVKAETMGDVVVAEAEETTEPVEEADELTLETLQDEEEVKEIGEDSEATEQITTDEVQENEAEEKLSEESDGEVEAIVTFANGTQTSYATLLEAIAAAKGNTNNVVLMQKDIVAGDTDIIIDDALTLDLGGHELKAHPTGNENWDFGPLYLKNDDANKVVVIKNGTISAEIDGGRAFNSDEIQFKGPVVLDDITLIPLADDVATDSGGNKISVPASLWTDGHPYTLRNCNFSKATIKNLWSTVTIESGDYNALSWGAENGHTHDEYGTIHETKDFIIKGGTFPNNIQEKGDMTIAPGYVQTEEGGKYVITPIPVKADQSNVPNKPVIVGMMIQVGEQNGSISITAERGVQYTLNSPDGPWYYTDDHKINRSYTDGRPDVGFGKGPDDEGVYTSGTNNEIITFIKDKNGNPIQEGTTYTIYAKYTKDALEADETRSPAIVSSDAKMTTASAVEIAKLFNQPDENGTDASKKTIGSKLSATNPKVDVTIGLDGKITVILKDQVNGTVTLPDELGDVTIDLKGNDIVGPAGSDSANGGAAIAVVPTTKEGTTITIIDTADKKGSIKGGDAKPGSGKDGGDGIEIDDQANATVNIGPGVTVIGGNGASSDSQKGGNGGAGVDGTITKNEGTIIGGNGGDSKVQEGGNGGAGVDGSITDVNASTGVITGGNGGSSSAANGGNGGSGATGDVNRNDGKITGGNGGDATGANGNGGAGGQGAGGNVTTNTGAITGGNGGNATTGKGNGGLGGIGTGGDVTTNTGTITGGNGGNAGSGNGGNGGQGAGGNVSDNTGSVTGGNGGNAETGSGGGGGSAAGGNVGGNGSSNAGANGTSSEDDKTIAMSPVDAELYKNSESLADVEKAILTGNTDKGDIKGSDFSRLRLRAVAKNKAMTLKWKKQTKADGYIIYGSSCGSKMKKLKEFKSGKVTKWTQKKLKKGKYYKYTIVAYKKFGDEKRVIAKAIGVHATTPGGKYTNPTAVKLKTKNKITLKKGKSKTIKATYTAKGKVREHIRIVRFESSNKKIATVSKTGKVKALKKGSCTIFVYAQNGVYKTVKVTVK